LRPRFAGAARRIHTLCLFTSRGKSPQDEPIDAAGAIGETGLDVCALHETEMARYCTEGYGVFRNVIDAALISEVRAHVEWLQGHRPANFANSELCQLHRMNDDPFWLRVVSDDRLLDVAGRFVGPDIALFNSSYFCKAANSGSAVLWHQDRSYWPIESAVVTVWLAVDDSAQDNGCLRVIPGSQHEILRKLIERTDTPNILGSGIDEGLIDESKAVDLVLQAGDVSVHHPHIIHGSRANLSSKRRCGLAIRYIPTSTKIVVPAGERFPGAFLLRGRDENPGLNDYNPMPPYVAGRHMPFNGCENWGCRK
jgi:Phytanoyl-CoA dioxygenase (PhyH)